MRLTPPNKKPEQTLKLTEIHLFFQNLKIAVILNAPKITAVKTTVFDLEIIGPAPAYHISGRVSKVPDGDRERTRTSIKILLMGLQNPM